MFSVKEKMVRYLNITTAQGVNMLELDRQECLQLELKLNVSPKGRDYIDIGDVLFSFAQGTYSESEYVVSEEAFLFLQDLHHTNH